MTNPAVALAESVVEVLKDTDENTASVALKIAELLLRHRSSAEVSCRLHMLNDEMLER